MWQALTGHRISDDTALQARCLQKKRLNTNILVGWIARWGFSIPSWIRSDCNQPLWEAFIFNSQWCVFHNHCPWDKGVLWKSRAYFLRSIKTTTCNTMPHKIHVTGIFSYIWLILIVNVGKDLIHGSFGYMDPMNSTLTHTTHKRFHVCSKVSQEALADLTADARIVVDRTLAISAWLWDVWKMTVDHRCTRHHQFVLNLYKHTSIWVW